MVAQIWQMATCADPIEKTRKCRCLQAAVVVVSILVTTPVVAQLSDDMESLSQSVIQLSRSGKTDEALRVAQEAVKKAEQQFGGDHQRVGEALDVLGIAIGAKGRLKEAEPIHVRSLAIFEKSLGKDHPMVGLALEHLGFLYVNQGRPAEAEALIRRALAIREKHAPQSWPMEAVLNGFGYFLAGQKRYDEAEPFLRRALSIREALLPSNDPNLASSLRLLGIFYGAQGQYAAAAPLWQRSLNILEKREARTSPQLLADLRNLAGAYRALGRYAEAIPLELHRLEILNGEANSEAETVEALDGLGDALRSVGRNEEAQPYHERALGIREAMLGHEHADIANSLSRLAILHQEQGRFSEAEPLHKRALAIREKVLGSDNADVASALENIGALYRQQGRYADAEPLFQRALQIRERVLGQDDLGVAGTLTHLALQYHLQHRLPEAEALLKRAIAIREKQIGPNALVYDHLNLAESLNNLALVYSAKGRNGDARPLLVRALSILEAKLGPESPKTAKALGNLGYLYGRQNRIPEAESMLKRALTIQENVFGRDHPELCDVIGNLGDLYRETGRFSEAEAAYQRALGIDRSALPEDHPLVAYDLNNLGYSYYLQGRWDEAIKFLQLGTNMSVARARLLGADLFSSLESTLSKRTWFGGDLELTLLMKAAAAGRDAEDVKRDFFKTAQLSRSSEAAFALTQMAIRKGHGTVANMIRERQDLVAEWQAGQLWSIGAVAKPVDFRDVAAENKQRERLAWISSRVAQIDMTLANESPRYAALASPEPLNLDEAQALLDEDEALILFLDTPQLQPRAEETFVWVITKTNSRWVRSDLGTNAMTERVAALRCGLDNASWTAEGQARCATLLGLDPAKPRPRVLLFDVAKAHKLYKGLFEGIEDLLVNPDGKGRHLLIVPSGPLTSLPLQVLVTEEPVAATTTDYASVAWLAKRHAVTVLPSVASLAALRRNPKASAATEPFIGFGSPVLVGQAGCGKIVVPVRCPGEQEPVAEAPSAIQQISSVFGVLSSYFRNGQANVAELRKLCPLPDTAHELKCVAKSLGVPESSISLGREMTEARLKKTPLDHFGIVHFATHGLLSGETAQFAKERAEPALVMSPPDSASELDDGLLTASEVAGLKLDADWVVMSACNTAGGGAPGAEALSGLARAFFYAGARALLVSHWPVNSYAATMLTTRTFAELKRDKTIGRSEALRRAMVAFISDEKRPWAAHPAIWAPFVVVGEGGVPGSSEPEKSR